MLMYNTYGYTQTLEKVMFFNSLVGNSKIFWHIHIAAYLKTITTKSNRALSSFAEWFLFLKR